MCGGGGGGTDEYAEQQRKEQEERERRIRAGMDQLEAIFEGGTRGTGRAESFDASKTYYDAAGNVIYAPSGSSAMRGAVDPVTGGTFFVEGAGPSVEGAPNVHLGSSDFRLANPYGPEGSSVPVYAPSDEAFVSEDIRGQADATVQGLGDTRRRILETLVERGAFPAGGSTGATGATQLQQGQEFATLEEMAANGELFTGTEPTTGFTDDFYDRQRQAYLQFANPQADEQFEDAQENLTFALSRAGTLNSSIAADRFAEAGQDYDEARGLIADRADDVANQTRRSVADERARLTSLLNASADPSTTLAGIGRVLDGLRSTPAFDPIGPIFQNVTAGIGNFAQGRRYADMQRRLNDLFRSPDQGSGRTVGG